MEAAHLHSTIRHWLGAFRLGADARLPPERELAKKFRVSRAELRKGLIAVKKNRRIEVGPFATFHFESYETMWLHAGEAWGIDPVDSVTRIAQQGRGGYCYHLNGAFAELLRSLGYLVTRHVGGVHGAGGPDAESVVPALVGRGPAPELRPIARSERGGLFGGRFVIGPDRQRPLD